MTVDPTGTIIAKHRKVHLFDIDVPGKITFKESDTLTAGDSPTTFDTPFGKVTTAEPSSPALFLIVSLRARSAWWGV